MKGGEDMMETLTGRGEREVEALRGDVVEFCKKISGDRLLPGSPVSAQDHRLCPRPPSLPKPPSLPPKPPKRGRGEGREGRAGRARGTALILRGLIIEEQQKCKFLAIKALKHFSTQV